MKEIAKSPSQTTEWLRCPILRTLNTKMGIKPKMLSRGEIAAIAGNAFAKAMEVYHKEKKGVDEVVNVGLQEVEQIKRQIENKGRVVPDREMAYYGSLVGRVEHGIRKYISNDPLKTLGLVVEDVELKLPEHGNARIDLGVRDNFGLSVVDYKFKLRLDSKYYDKEVERYRNSWQQYHYCWAYSEYKQEPINNYYICLVVVDPKFSVKLHEFPIHPETMEMWKESAHRVWTQMEHEDAGLTKPWMAASHEDQFGPCPYQRACFDYRFDMNLLTQEDYVVVQEEEKDR